MACRVADCGSVTISRLNKNHPASKCQGSPISGSHSDKRYCVLDPVEPSIKDDCGTCGSVLSLSGKRSGRAKLRKELREELKVITVRTDSQRRKARPIDDITSTTPEVNKWPASCWILGCNVACEASARQR
jgi:hypothetical protein